MRKLLFLLAILPSLLLAQATDSWVNFKVQYDFYGWQESNWFMVEDTVNGDTAIFHAPTYAYQYLDTTININSGNYVVTLTDSWGDGWISNSPAHFKMMNDCQGLIIDWDPVLGSFYLRDTTVTILPCAPPVMGCTDSNATNYDSTATVDDGSCIFPPCGGLILNNAYQMCWANGQAAIAFEWGTSGTNPNCAVSKVWLSNDEGLGPYAYVGTWGDQPYNVFTATAGMGQQSPNWSVEYYLILEFADGSLSDTIAYTPEACIDGCMDSTSVAYNPWATNDDGSCGGTACDTLTEYQIQMQITFDNWPGETSWIMNSNGIIDEAPVGTYDYNDVGQTYTYDFCVAQSGFELIINDTYGDGMAGSTSGGTIDGTCVIYDCNGDTIWYMDNPGFGSVLYSGVQQGVPCAGPVSVPGCLDPLYQEFNPLANTDDGSCTNLHIFGCTDTAAFNYDPTASQMDLVPLCNYTLIIEDDGGDGWGNSYLGVTQGTNTWTYTMGPGSYSQSFPINLTTNEPVTVYYFEVQGPQTTPEELEFQTMHNSFTLTNANGVILLEEGTNPFANNGQGALQGFGPPFWTTYSALPYCGDYCIPKVYGCMDSTALNYDPLANTPITCIPIVLGCTNPLAFNYDSLANTDDGTCISIIIGCMDSTAFNFNPSANTNDPSSCIPVILGCMDDTMFNYNAAANTDDGSCIPIIFGCTDPTAFNYDSIANTNNGSCIPVIWGCTDPLAFNFNPNANTDDLSCIPVIIGCTDPSALNYDSTANTNNGCIYPILGCTDPAAFNYNPLANVDDSTCIPVIIGCTDPTALNYDSIANTNNGCIYPIYGCTDPTMFNYDPNANVDDSTCVPVIIGCTDPTALNYDSVANTNSGCIYPIYGCTDPTMFNYDPNANVDDSTCVPVIIGCTDPTALNYDSVANTNNGCIYAIYGCTDPTMFNYDPNANTDDSTCVPYIYGCTDPTAFNYDSLANTNVGCIYPVLGCTDPNAFNYDPLANTDDSSCVPFIYGCTDAMMWNYNPSANTDNGSCLPYIYGCTDSTQYNYDPLANTNNGSCIPYIYGCTDSTAFNFNPLANTDNNTCLPILYGCTDSTALNWNPLANTNDNSCIPFIYGCTDSTAINYNSLANTDDGTCVYPILGCTDSSMFNYDPTANTDDGSCIPYVYGCTDPTMFNYDPLANTDNNSCVPFIYGCTDPTMFNYDATANTDNGSCVPFIYGCIDSTMFNYDPIANTDNGSCIPFIYGCTDNAAFNFDPLANTLDNSCCYIAGCTDSTALNYDPNACYDDNSCITPISGCTDVAAYNYNPAANVSDSTACLYDAGCYGGPGIPYWLNDGCYAWVISVDDYCCTTDWDASCIQMYDYCQLGWPTAIEDISALGIIVYPNPTTDIITIETRLDIEVEVYDIMGKLLISKDSKRIDLSEYPNGVYSLILIYNNKQYTTRVIKQ